MEIPLHSLAAGIGFAEALAHIYLGSHSKSLLVAWHNRRFSHCAWVDELLKKGAITKKEIDNAA